MDIDRLVSIGLSPSQAEAYALLVKNGATKPAIVAQRLRLTRTNAYKVLDSLVDVEIVERIKQGKTLAYQPANPIALANLTAKYRAEAVAREESVRGIMHELLETYSKHTDKPGVSTYFGREKVIEAYRKQINLREDVSFVHTGADVPMMGFDIMHELRMEPSSRGNQRRTIIRAPLDKKVNYTAHQRSNLEPTWIESGRYTEPVEWSVTKSSLLIVSYKTEPQAILIIDQVIAAAFLQLYKIMESYISKESIHQEIESTRTSKSSS